MPLPRLLGNVALTFMTKLASGYWHIFDPQNGYTAIRADMLSLLNLSAVHKRFFFENDMLFQLNLQNARVKDVPIPAKYGATRSRALTSCASRSPSPSSSCADSSHASRSSTSCETSRPSPSSCSWEPLLFLWGFGFGAFLWIPQHPHGRVHLHRHRDALRPAPHPRLPAHPAGDRPRHRRDAEVTDVSVIVLGWNGRQLGARLSEQRPRPGLRRRRTRCSSSTTAPPTVPPPMPRPSKASASIASTATTASVEGNNKPSRSSKGRLVVFLNQDVVVHRDWLRELVAAVESDDAIKAAHANIVHPWNEASTSSTASPPRAPTRPSSLDSPSSSSAIPASIFPSSIRSSSSGAALILKRDVVAESRRLRLRPRHVRRLVKTWTSRSDCTASATAPASRRVPVVYHHHVLHDAVSLPAPSSAPSASSAIGCSPSGRTVPGANICRWRRSPSSARP